GTSTQTFNVTMTLTGGYTSTKTVTALAPNATKQVAFNSWTPSVMGTNMVKMYTQLAGDGYRMNDTLIDTLHISHISNDDIKAVSINVPLKTGNTAQTPMATVRNNGFNTESFNVTMTITGGYTSTIPVTNLAPFATQQISFASWTPSVLGNNTVKFYSQLATDANKTNDTLQTVIQVFPAFVNYGWSSKPVMPDKFFGNASAFYHTGTYPNDTSIVFSLCGIDSTGAMGTINTAYSSLTNNWGPKSSAPYARYQGSAQTVNGKVYLMGGFVPGLAPSNRNDIYTIASNSWSIGSSMPQSIADFATAVYKDSLIYVIGGWDSTATPTNNVQIYNTYTNAWTSGTAKTGTATYGVRCGIYKNKIVAVGGSDGTSPKNEAVLGVINAAAPGTIAWSALPNYPGFPVLRHTGGSVYKDELPLIIFTSGDTAGYSNAGVTYFTNETWGYDLVANMWKIGPPKITGTNDNMNLLGAVFNDSLYMISVGGHGSTKPLRVNEWLNMGPDTSSHILGVAQKQVAALQVNVYPNPFNDKTTVTFDLAKEQKIVAGVYDVHGRLVAELANKIFSTGTYSLVWNSSSCASGIYMLRIVVGNAALNKKLIKN
ncbi:MAG TPA: T9SS type A sorting domain-containing protein, partial [Bacteroidia bacterium]|nr:T9SS type A sorting domain-containing protein [Bacteroidia bacterium]